MYSVISLRDTYDDQRLLGQTDDCVQELDIKVSALDPAYGAAVLPFPDALLRLPRLRALSLQIHCVVSSFIPPQTSSYC
jgi:hypothetical protein